MADYRQTTPIAAAITLISLAIAPPASAGDMSPFTEEASTRGINFVVIAGPGWGRGAAFADLDGDGDPDLVTGGGAGGLVGVYENTGGGMFADRSGASGIGMLSSVSGVTAGDHDNDGDLDVYLARWSAPNVLLRNDESFHFTDVTAAAAVGGGNADTAGCGWADYDNDGRLDLYVGNWGIEPNRLYRNLGPNETGDIIFADVAVDLGVDLGNHPTFQATFLDFDRDGDADLYVASDRGVMCEVNGFFNHLFENTGGAFIDITESSGTAACVDAMSIAVGDFDGNGLQDLYCTNTPPGNALLLNDGEQDGVWTFHEAADTAGVAVYALGWGSTFLDFDNDGMLDLYVCNASVPNRLHHNAARWPCSDVAGALDADLGGPSYTVESADIDGDGDRDLLVQNSGEALRLLVNHEGEKRNWAKFDVVGRGPSRFAVGANVEVRTGAARQLREVIAGSNYKGQNELILHFGLGAAAMIDEIDVAWPGGATRTLTSFSANNTWTLYPTDKLGDGDQDGDRDVHDFLVFAGCYTGDDPGSLSPGCEMMDLSGDGDVDLDDFDVFLDDYNGPQPDCDDNGVIDLVDILLGAPDVNQNGVLDTCDVIPGDVNDDLFVDSADLAILLAAWGPCGGCPEDLDADGQVAFGDLLILLANWG